MNVKGTLGYPGAIEKLREATDAIDFHDLHGYCLKYLPKKPGRALDIGFGSGRDATIMASLGHSVVAVEPCQPLFDFAINSHPSSGVNWVQDSLPCLAKLVHKPNQFDFILCSAVWHHLDNAERDTALTVISRLLKPGGIFAVTLRNGPAGIGTHVFPTDTRDTIDAAKPKGLKNLLCLENQPSLVKNKPLVIWSKLVFRKGD